MPSPETRLVLIRHGESRAQAAGIISGHDTCHGLTPRGRGQVEALRDRLATTGELGRVDVIYTSILPRAIETAEIVRPALAGDAETRRECAFCELHPGEAEGLEWAEFRARFASDTDAEDAFKRRAPGMETWAECYERVGERLRRIATEHSGQCVVVVAHGGTVGSSFVALGGLPAAHGRPFTHGTTNASMTEWRANGGGWRLVRFNDGSHEPAGR
jgi:2,3-bisphosphoglycerate-dependent phosphoglycerate mutase